MWILPIKWNNAIRVNLYLLWVMTKKYMFSIMGNDIQVNLTVWNSVTVNSFSSQTLIIFPWIFFLFQSVIFQSSQSRISTILRYFLLTLRAWVSPSADTKIWLDISPQTLFVPRSKQFSDSEAQGKLWALRNRYTVPGQISALYIIHQIFSLARN